MRILIVSTYPLDKGPSQRFRIGQYLSAIKKAGHSVEYHAFFDEEAYQVLYRSGKFWTKVKHLIRGFSKRLLLTTRLYRYDCLWIQREASIIGPPTLAFIARFLFRKRLVFDFDDAIWLPNYTEANARFHRLKSYWKVRYLIKWSHQVIAGNEFLADFARQYNSQVTVIPTVVDTETYYLPNGSKGLTEIPTVGWTGSISTVPHLASILPILNEVPAEIPFRMLVISNSDPAFTDFDYEFRQWDKEREIQDLNEMDIGIMPLPDNEWTRGKCGFKAIQYMSLGIPTIASPVGMNQQLIDHGRNGILSSTPEEWKASLMLLLTDTERRQALGKSGRSTIESHYSVSSQCSKLIEALVGEEDLLT
ncbi:MAG: glycosyltransferase family 4 protein [Flavobacteriales bacterium]|nr:glycosyltransferase family 4 protein [Flavobacteriales bacterium]